MSARNELRSMVTGNLVYKFASLVLAVLLWVWVQHEQVVTDRAHVALSWALPDGMVATEPLLPSVVVTLEGVQAGVRAAHQHELTMYLDLTKARAGDVTVDLSDKVIKGLPEQVRVVSVYPASLRVDLDRILRKKVEVVAAPSGEIAPGFALKNVSVKPAQVELMGPSTLLRGVTQISTDPVDLSGLREDETLQVGLDIKDGIKPTHGATVAVVVDVEEVRKTRRMEGVPVVLADDGRFEIGVSQVTVTVSGQDAALGALGPQSLTVRVVVPTDYDGRAGEVPPGTQGLHYTVEHPDDVEVLGVEPERLPLIAKGGGG